MSVILISRVPLFRGCIEVSRRTIELIRSVCFIVDVR